MNSSTALLVFSRSAAAEASSKKIFCRVKQNRKVIEGFIHHTIRLATQCNLPWYLSDEHSQTGEAFGKKLGNAISQVLAKGYRKLIIIGNDCPGLTQNVLQKAVTDLEHHDWVLGPTSKGGVYLLGISAASFDKTGFEKISWQTSEVFASLQGIITKTGVSYFCLQALDDINTTKDVISVANKTSSNNSLLSLLINFFVAGTFRYFNHTTIVLCVDSFSSCGRRGPPIKLC